MSAQKTHKLKNRDIIHSYQLLARLDELKGTKGSAKLRLAKIGLTLKGQNDLIIETRNKMAKEAFPEIPAVGDKAAVPAGTVDQKASQFAAFAKDVEGMLDEEVSIELPDLKASDLNLDNNDVPISVLMALDWLITKDSTDESK